jgi:hypothetical protein
MAFDWRALVKSVAPSIGTALGGPLGGVAGLALAKVLGVPDASAGDDTALAAAVQGATPEQLLALKKADQDFQIQMTELGFKDQEAIAAINAEDRASARDREVKTQDKTPRILAGVVVFGFLWSVWYVLSGRVQGLKDPATIGMVGTLIGYISAKADTVVGYYFGSSAGSDRKTEILGGKP